MCDALCSRSVGGKPISLRNLFVIPPDAFHICASAQTILCSYHINVAAHDLLVQDVRRVVVRAVRIRRSRHEGVREGSVSLSGRHRRTVGLAHRVRVKGIVKALCIRQFIRCRGRDNKLTESKVFCALRRHEDCAAIRYHAEGIDEMISAPGKG